MAVGAEEFEAELHSTGVPAHVAGDCGGPVDVRRVDGDENGVHSAGSPSSMGAGGAGLVARWRSIASWRRFKDQMRARMVSQVGRRPRRNTVSSSSGILMSAWMSPQRLRVTSLQLRVPNSTMTTAISTQRRVFRNCITCGALGEPCVED